MQTNTQSVTIAIFITGSALLIGSHAAVAPTAAPTTPDDALLVAAWWLAAGLLAWWTLSVSAWLTNHENTAHVVQGVNG